MPDPTADLAPAFDYAALPAADRQFVRDKVGVIRHLARQCGESVIHIGRHLTAVRERIRGRFTAWVEAEFTWTRRHADRMMAAAETFATQGQIVQRFDASALYALSEPQCPPQAREYAVELAKDGQFVSHREAREIIDAVRKGGDVTKQDVRRYERDRPKDAPHPEAEPEDLFSDYKTLWLAFKKLVTSNNSAIFTWEPYCMDDSNDEVQVDPETHLHKAHFRVELYRQDSLKARRYDSTTYLETLILEAADAHPMRTCERCGRTLRLYEDFGSKKGNRFNRSRSCKKCEVKRVGEAKKGKAATPPTARTAPTPASPRPGSGRDSSTA